MRMVTFKRLIWLIWPVLTICGKNECNQIHPVEIPIRNVSLWSGGEARGADISFGTPKQRIAAIISPSSNNTALYGAESPCGNQKTAQCQASRGGIYDRDRSSTWKLAGAATGAGAAAEVEPVSGRANQNFSNSIWGNDVVYLRNNMSVSAYPISTIEDPDWIASCIGMGRNATILNALVSAGKIASKTWGLFWGLVGESAETQMDGSLILGGYDKAKVKGENETISFTGDDSSHGCPTSLQVEIADIRMGFSNGTSFSIMLGQKDAVTAPYEACIDPAYPIISMPPNPWENFLLNAGGTAGPRSRGLNVGGQTYDADGVYDGNLTFTLKSGFQVTIPNNQLVVPDYAVNDTGFRTSDNSTREVLINGLQGYNQDKKPLLGQTFLTQVYLLVDNEASKFTMWNANPTMKREIVTLGKDLDCPILSQSSYSSTSQDVAAARNMSGGAIAGTIIGVTSILAILGAIAVYFLRRHMKTDFWNWSVFSKSLSRSEDVPSLPLHHSSSPKPDPKKQAHELQGEEVYWELEGKESAPRSELCGAKPQRQKSRRVGSLYELPTETSR